MCYRVFWGETVVVPCKPWWEEHLFPFVCLTQIAWTWYNACVNTNTTMLIQSSAPKTTITGPSVSLPVPIACTEKTSSAQSTGARLSTCLVLYEGGLRVCPSCGFWASENPSIVTSFTFCARALEKAQCHQSLTAAFGEGTELHIKPSEPKFRMAASYMHSTTKLSAGVG